MTRRKQRQAAVRWEAETRTWATDAGRALVLALSGGYMVPATPYRVGVVLRAGERPWAECPARFLPKSVRGPHAGNDPSWPPVRPWLVTSARVVGRLGDDRLYGYRWDDMVGCRIDLSEGRERVCLDLDRQTPLTWAGPGVAPMAVVAVYHLHDATALLDHPSLSPLRSKGAASRIEVRPVAELPDRGTSPVGWWQ